MKIISSVALAFFAFLGFGVITFTAKDLPHPVRQLPRAIYLALAIATAVYVAVSLACSEHSPRTGCRVRGDRIGGGSKADAGPGGIRPDGDHGVVLHGWRGECEPLPVDRYDSSPRETGQFPRAFGRQIGRRAPVGLVVMALLTIFMIIALDLNSIASLGSAVALLIFSSVTASHFKTYEKRMRT